MAQKDLTIDVDSEGVQFKRERVIEEGFSTIEQFTWDDVGAVQISEIGSVDKNEDSETPFPVNISNCNVIINLESDREHRIMERNYWKELKDETGIAYYRSGSVKFDSSKTLNGNFEDFVTFMFEKEYLTMNDLPCEMPNARKNFILNSSKQTSDGEMEHAEEINVAEGVFYNPKDPAGQKKEHIEHIIKQQDAWP